MCPSNQLLGAYSVANNILGISSMVVRNQILCLMGATHSHGRRPYNIFYYHLSGGDKCSLISAS